MLARSRSSADAPLPSRPVLVFLLAILSAAAAPAAPCPDGAALAEARSAVDVACPCAEAADRRAYLRCVAAVVKTRVDAGALPKACAGSVRRCAKSSSCARPGTAPCCTTSAAGQTTCRVTTPDRCTQRGGCIGTVGSCCDACGSPACPISTTTSTTLAPPVTHFTACCEIPTPSGACSVDMSFNVGCIPFGDTAVARLGRSPTGTNICSGFPYAEFTSNGPCGPITTFAPTRMCCDFLHMGLGCTEAVVSDSEASARFQASCAYASIGGTSFYATVGRCGPDEHCIPGN